MVAKLLLSARGIEIRLGFNMNSPSNLETECLMNVPVLPESIIPVTSLRLSMRHLINVGFLRPSQASLGGGGGGSELN